MSDSQAQKVDPGPAPLHGLLAEYDTPTALVKAAKAVRDAGYTNWDTYSPFAIHGIERAMGIRMTRLPWLVFGFALAGLTTGVLLQYLTNAVNYPWLVSGKPIWSWPANVPIVFEMTILYSAFAAIGGMMIFNNLPLPAHPLDLKERFQRVTDDKFFLLIEARDPKFDEKETKELIEATKPVVLEEVQEDRTSSDKIPPALIYTLIILGAASLVPFGAFAVARSQTSPQTRIHAIWDMDFQPKYKAQRENPLFPDQRAARPPTEGTVAVGFLRDDEHLYRGLVNGQVATAYPAAINPTEETLLRGQQKFNTFCAPCHGLSGEGDGMVHQRAQTLGGAWVPPSNLHQEYLRLQPVGELFKSITQGVRNMPAYGDQIEPEDRWAIVMYVRALQRTQASKLQDLTDSERSGLK